MLSLGETDVNIVRELQMFWKSGVLGEDCGKEIQTIVKDVQLNSIFPSARYHNLKHAV